MKAIDLRINNPGDWKKYFWITLAACMLLLILSSVFHARNEYKEWKNLRNQTESSLLKAHYMQNAGLFLEARDEYEGILNNISSNRFPGEYIITQNNLGYIYQHLAKSQDREENILNAIKAYRESLRVSTQD